VCAIAVHALRSSVSAYLHAHCGGKYLITSQTLPAPIGSSVRRKRVYRGLRLRAVRKSFNRV
jgi:hypothetical protein